MIVFIRGLRLVWTGLDYMVMFIIFMDKMSRLCDCYFSFLGCEGDGLFQEGNDNPGIGLLNFETSY